MSISPRCSAVLSRNQDMLWWADDADDSVMWECHRQSLGTNTGFCLSASDARNVLKLSQHTSLLLLSVSFWSRCLFPHVWCLLARWQVWRIDVDVCSIWGIDHAAMQQLSMHSNSHSHFLTDNRSMLPHRHVSFSNRIDQGSGECPNTTLNVGNAGLFSLLVLFNSTGTIAALFRAFSVSLQPL